MRKIRILTIILLIVVGSMFYGCKDITKLTTQELKQLVEREGEKGKFAFYYSFMLGNRYFGEGNYEEAIKYFERSKKVYKKDMLVFRLDYGVDYWIGRSYLALNKYQEAIEYLNRAASIAPISLRDIALYPEYAAEFERGYAPYIPTKGLCYRWLTSAYYLSGKYQDAIEAYKKAIELDPNLASYDYDFLSTTALTYANLKRYDDALMIANKAIEINKTEPFSYAILALIYYSMERYNDAIFYLKKAEELNPPPVGLLTIYDKMVDIYARMGKFDEAISSLRKAISLKTSTGIGIKIAIEENYLVVKDLMEGPAKRAGIEVGDKIIKINGQSIKGWDINKVIQALRGAEGTQVVLTIKRKELKDLIEKTLTRETIIEKSAAPFFGLRSLVYRIKGNAEDAEKDAEKAYSLDPNTDNAKEALGATYIDKGKYDDAIKILSTTSKDNYFARILEATAYAKQGDFKKAVEIYNSIPEDYLSAKNVLRQSYKNAFLESLKSYVNIRKEVANSLEAKEKYREALNEYAEALKLADEKETKYIRSKIASLIKKNPYLTEIPEEARKFALRGEGMLKDGKFEEALREYKKAINIAPYVAVLYRSVSLIYGELKDYTSAINYMNIYLELMPDAPDARAVKDQIYNWEFMLEKNQGEKQ